MNDLPINDLRLILLGFGVLLIGAVWIWSLYARRRTGSSRAISRKDRQRAGGRRRAPARGEAKRKSSGPSRARRGETLALDLPLDSEDEEPGVSPHGLDAPLPDGDAGGATPDAGIGGTLASSRPMRGARRGTRDRESDSGAGSRHRDEPREWRARAAQGSFLEATEDPERASPIGDLRGLRATREEPEQLEMGTFDLDGDVPGPDPEDASAGEDSGEEEPKPETLVVILTVLARKGERIEGAALRAALEAQGLRYGDDRIFHRYPDAAPASVGPLFSAVNIVEPGVFELETMDSMHTPGMGLFMRLPGPKDPGDAFAKMVEAARELAGALGAQLCDETRSKLTAQTLNHLREQIADFGRRRLLRV